MGRGRGGEESGGHCGLQELMQATANSYRDVYYCGHLTRASEEEAITSTDRVALLSLTASERLTKELTHRPFTHKGALVSKSALSAVASQRAAKTSNQVASRGPPHGPNSSGNTGASCQCQPSSHLQPPPPLSPPPPPAPPSASTLLIRIIIIPMMPKNVSVFPKTLRYWGHNKTKPKIVPRLSLCLRPPSPPSPQPHFPPSFPYPHLPPPPPQTHRHPWQYFILQTGTGRN